jgi:hypothetical protein
MHFSAEAVDSVHHLLLECDQADLEALRLAQQPGSSMKQLMTLAYDVSQTDSLASYIHAVMTLHRLTSEVSNPSTPASSWCRCKQLCTNQQQARR